MNWNDAIEEAKEELNIEGYTEDWDEVVDRAKEILEEYKENNKDEIQETKLFQKSVYKRYLKSDRWKRLREEALERDNYKCKKCGEKAQEVHHTRYDHKDTPWEIHTIVSLCRECHKSEHKKKTIFR